MLLRERMLRAVGANMLPVRLESRADRDAVQKYLDTRISANWGRTLRNAQIYVVLVVGDERDRSVRDALLQTGTKEIEKFACGLADALEAKVARFDLVRGS